MYGKWSYIGGGAALLFAGIVASRYELPARVQDETEPPAAATGEPALSAVAASEEAPPQGADADIAGLNAALAAQEAENARLRTTLAVRDAVLSTLRASLADREAALGDLQAAVDASNAELTSLRSELAALRDQPGLDAQLVAVKAGAEPSATRVETLRQDTPDLEALFDEAKAPLFAPPAPVAPAMVEVHFDFASAALTPGGRAYAAAAAVTLADMALDRIRVIGHTDRVGSPAGNLRLATRRADAVANFLVASGLPREMIEIDGMGETDLPVATADGIPEPLNRTVAIVPVPMPVS